MNPIYQWQCHQEKILEEFISSRIGIVKNLYELTREPDAPDVFSYVSELCDMNQFHFQQCGRISTGIGISRFHAKTAAIGEAIERYGASFYDPDQIILASFNEMISKGLNTAHPETFALYSEKEYQQYPHLNRFTKDTKIGWTKGISLTNHQTETWIPAAFVFLPYQYKEKETQIAAQISTGLSCAFDLDTAIMNSICEIIERESVMLTWLHRLSCTELCFGEANWLANLFYQRFSRSGFTYSLVLAPGDLGLYTVFALMRDKGRKIIATGSSTKPDLKQAALKALLETVQVRELLKSIPKGRRPQFHLELYQDISLSKDLRQLFTPSISHCMDDPDSSISLNELIKNCQQRGLDLYMAELTTSDIADVGLRVVRIVIPQAIRLCREFEIPYLGGSRLFQVPKNLGFNPLSEEELNLKPHPFG